MFNTLSVVRAIAEPRKKSILPIQQETIGIVRNQLSVQASDGKCYAFHYKKIILYGGQGNESLLSRFGHKQPEMQFRPLKMVVMRGGENSKLR